MKKQVAALMMAMVMVVIALAGCGSDPVVGSWKVSTIQTAGVTMDLDEYVKQMEAAGQSIDSTNNEMVISSDGKVTMDVFGSTAEGTWTYSDSVLTIKDSNGQESKGEYSDGKITVDESGVKIVFEKK